MGRREACWAGWVGVFVCMVLVVRPCSAQFAQTSVQFPTDYYDYFLAMTQHGGGYGTSFYTVSWCWFIVWDSEFNYVDFDTDTSGACDAADWSSNWASSFAGMFVIEDSNPANHGVILASYGLSFKFVNIAPTGSLGSQTFLGQVTTFQGRNHTTESLQWNSVTLMRFVMDDIGWAWMQTEEGVSGNLKESIFAWDRSGTYRAAGVAFRVFPVEDDEFAHFGWRDLKVLGNLVVFYSVTSNTYMVFENGKPEWDAGLGAFLPYTRTQLSAGPGTRSSTDLLVNSSLVLDVGSTVILSRYDLLNPTLSKDDVFVVDFLKKDDPTNTRVSAVIGDDWGYYAYVGDNRGDVYQVRLDGMEEEHRSLVWSTTAILGFESWIARLGFDGDDLSLWIQMGVDTLARVYAYDCSTHATGSACLENGGRYCAWNTATHTCEVVLGAHDVQTLPRLDSVTPVSLAITGGTNLTVNVSNLNAAVSLKCAFAYPANSWPPFNSTRASILVSPGALGNGIIGCETPDMTVAPNGGSVGVWVVYDDGEKYAENFVSVEVHYCDVPIVPCAALPDCGICAPEMYCTSRPNCSGVWSESALPELESISPPSGPADYDGVPILVRAKYPWGFDLDHNFWCYFGPPGSEIKRKLNVSTTGPEGVCIAPNAPLLAPLQVHIFVLIPGRGFLPFTFDNNILFSAYDCKQASSCATCQVAGAEYCRWCPYRAECVGFGNCADGIQVESCPKIVEVSPYSYPASVFEPLLVGTANFPNLVPPVNLSCVVEATVNGNVSTFSANASFDLASKTVRCVTPPLPASTPSVYISGDAGRVTEQGVHLSIYDCRDSVQCSDCYGAGLRCGWCMDEARCVVESKCPTSSLWLRNPDQCPGLQSVFPFSGSTAGGTEVVFRVLSSRPLSNGTTYVPSSDSIDGGAGPLLGRGVSDVLAPASSAVPLYGCMFNDIPVNGSYLSSDSMSCVTPQMNSSGFSMVNVLFKSAVFSKNALSFVFVDCSVDRKTCRQCVSSKNADCGWCVATAKCTNPSLCTPGYFVNVTQGVNCPTMSASGVSFSSNGGQVVWYTLSMLPPPGEREDTHWKCQFGNTETGGSLHGDRIKCWTPAMSPGQHDGTVLFKGAVYAGTARLVFVRPLPVDEYNAGDFGPNFALVLTLLAFFHWLMMTLVILKGRKKPVIVVASPFFCYLMLFGGLIAVVSCFFFIWKPRRGVCIVRPWLWSIAATFVFGGLYAKTFRMYRIFRNPRLRRVKFKRKTVLFWIGLMLHADAALLIVWSAASPYDAQLVEDSTGEKLVWRCRSKWSSVFEIIIFVTKGAFILLGCVLAVLTRNIKSDFNESRYIALSMYSTLMAAAVMIPLLWFGGLSEQSRPIIMVLALLFVFILPLSFVFVPKCLRIILRRTSLDGKGGSESTKKHKESLSDLVLKAQRGAGGNEETVLEEPGAGGFELEDGGFVSGSESDLSSGSGADTLTEVGTEAGTEVSEEVVIGSVVDTELPSSAADFGAPAVEKPSYFAAWMDAQDKIAPSSTPRASASPGPSKATELTEFERPDVVKDDLKEDGDVGDHVVKAQSSSAHSSTNEDSLLSGGSSGLWSSSREGSVSSSRSSSGRSRSGGSSASSEERDGDGEHLLGGGNKNSVFCVTGAQRGLNE